ncbi:MAG: DUF2852 domain-containing protein [Gemmatimonadaceae bacterium]|nr:DUF2852 domain-containing protein [Acetobacteraceae bacterium]
MDQVGRPAWVAATLLGFWLFWPIGLGVLGYLAWTGRLREMREGAPGQWFNLRNEAPKARGSRAAAGPSGNEAFDDYRAETLRRLEDEQREFVDYLERLRRARDKAEFDQFMAERRGGPPATDAGK